MDIESLNWFETILIFGFGAFATLMGLGVLWERDTEGRREFSLGIGLLSFGILLLSWSTGVLARMSPDNALVVVSVTGGLFALSVLWGLFRSMPRGYPTLTQFESVIEEGPGIPEFFRPPTSPQKTEASGRLGLVLEGGGAKGAYAFGCIKAFNAAGLRFDAISGSSVGGLNAALLASQQLEFGDGYWGSVTHGKVYRWNLLAPLLFPVLFARALLYGLSKATGIKEASPKAIIPKLILGGLLSVPGIWALGGIGGVVGWEAAPTLKVALFTAVLVIVTAVLVAIPLLTDRLALSLLIPSPLRKQVERIASDIDTSGTKVYVTLCERVPLVDPDYITAIDQTGGADRPFEEIVRVPVYTALNDLEPHERAQAIMASAALPVGIFPPVMLDGKRYSDGGEVDNVPVLPLISLLACDTLVVVRLRPNANPSRVAQYVGYMTHWTLCDRTVRLRSLPISEARAIVYGAYGGELMKRKTFNFPPVHFRCREPDFRPRNIITIAPRKELGGFFGGTLNFRGKKARAWIAMGFRDASEHISEIKGASEPCLPQPGHSGRSLTRASQ